VRRFTNRTSGLGLGPHGRLFGCQEGSRRIVEFNADGSATALGTTVGGRRHNFPGDLVVDRGQRIWFADRGSPMRSFGPQMLAPLDHASVLRLGRDPTTHRWDIQRVTEDTKTPRAVALSPDEKTLYVAEGNAETVTRDLRAYPVEPNGRVGAYALLHRFGHDQRGPQRGIEGMCLDTEGNIVACAGSSATGPGPLIYIFSPKGRVIATHEFPEDLPMRCAFGGSERGDLYVTTAVGTLWRAGKTGLRGYDRFA
jgi:gluconolactonase